MSNLTSDECYYKLKEHYCYSDCEEIITDICNYFDSNCEEIKVFEFCIHSVLISSLSNE